MTTIKRTQGTIVYPLVDNHSTFDQYALGVNPHTGETYLIHSEGVSYPVTHGKPWRFNDYNLDAPFYTLKDVRKFPVRGGVDLSVWIREFGARLETNFMLAHSVLNTTKPREEEYNRQIYVMLRNVGPVRLDDDETD